MATRLDCLLSRCAFVTAAAGLSLAGLAAHAQQADIVAGRTLFVQRCAVCHGEKADGQSSLARILDPKPANLLISRLDVAARNQIIRKGGASVGRSPVMPNWEAELPESDLRNVIGYVGSIAPAAESPRGGTK
jgi:mono/diheme cytochrome c family protein